MSDSLWGRVRKARLVRVLLVYLGTSWLVLQLTALLREEFQLPHWLTPVAAVLLLVGLVVVVATAWAQARPSGASLEPGGPTPWEVDLVDLRESVSRGRLPHLTWARAILGGVFVFSLLFGLAGLYVLLSERRPASTGPVAMERAAAPAVAVLPFRVVGPGLELWREGMVDLLSTNLDGAAGLRAVDPRAVLSRWGREVGEGEAPDRATALGVARGVGARYALVGSMVGSGQEVRLTGEVYSLDTGELLGTAQLEGAPDSILALVDALSMEVLRAGLVEGASDLPRLSLRRVTTSSVDALKAYLAGEQHYRAARWEEAVVDFTRAVEADSTFALALHRLSGAYGWLEAFSPRVIEYSRRAARYSDRLPEREALLLRGDAALDQGRLEAITLLDELTTRYPDDAEAWYQLSEAYMHLGPQGLHGLAEFRSAARRAIELDPTFGPAYSHLVHEAFFRQDHEAAEQLIGSVRGIDPTSPETQGFELAYDLLWGDSVTSARATAALDTAGSELLSAAWLCFFFQVDFAEQLMLVARPMTSQGRALDTRQFAYAALSTAHLYRGHMRESLAAMERAPDFEHRTARTHLLRYLAGYTHLPEPSEAARVLSDDPLPLDRFLSGSFAASEKRWSDTEIQMDALAASAESLSQIDSLSAAENRAFAQALRGYEALHRGDGELAIRELRAALPKLPGISAGGLWSGAHELVRFELGRLLLQLGRAEEAERYFRSLEFGPSIVGAQVEFYLGQVYEALSDPEQAKLHYARFVRLWEACDPELRPLRERGRQALQRLTRETVSGASG